MNGLFFVRTVMAKLLLWPYYTHMDFGTVSIRKYFFWVSIALILLFSTLNPEATAEIGFFGNLIFWTIQISILIPLLIFTQIHLQKIMIFDSINLWIKTGTAGILGSLLFIPIALLIDNLFGLDDWDYPHDTTSLILEEIGGVIPPATLTWLIINAPRILRLNFNPSETSKQSHKVKDKDLIAEFLDQIPKTIGTDIIYIMSELHYIRIVTIKGETLLIMSLEKAMKYLLTQYDGLQTHRSYWVNKAHIEKMVGKNTDKKILTNQGFLIPISRRKFKDVKSALRAT